MILSTAPQGPGSAWVQEPTQIQEGTEELFLCIFQTEKAKKKKKITSITELRYVPLQHFQSLGRNTHQAMNPVHPFTFWLKNPKNCHFFQLR